MIPVERHGEIVFVAAEDIRTTDGRASIGTDGHYHVLTPEQVVPEDIHLISDRD